MSENSGPNQKTQPENGQPKSGKRTHKNQKTRQTVSENEKIGRSKIRKQDKRRKKEPLQWRDGQTLKRNPMLLETTGAALHC